MLFYIAFWIIVACVLVSIVGLYLTRDENSDKLRNEIESTYESTIVVVDKRKD